MIQDLAWQAWSQLPRLEMTIVEVGYNRYQVRLQTGPESMARLTAVSAELRDQAAASLKQPYLEPELGDLRRIGSQMYQSLCPRPMRETLYDVYQTHRRQHEIPDGQPVPLRLRLEIQDPLLHFLPWEFLHDPSGVIGSPQAPLIVARYTPQPRPPGPLPFDRPLRILVVVASPPIKGDIYPPAEMDALEAAVETERVVLEMLDNPTREGLAEALAHKRPHVLHYIGHGYASRGSGYLALRRPEGSLSDFLSPSELGAMIPPGPLRLLGLQTPIGGPNYQLGAFAGFAAEIAAVNVGGICFSLLRLAASDLVHSFGELYTRLADGQPVDQALQSSRTEEVPALVGFHLYAASSQILADPYHSQVRIAPSPGAIDSYQATLERAIEKAPSATGAKAIQTAGDRVFVQLNQSRSQIVVPLSDLETLEGAWQDLDEVTIQVTGAPIKHYAEVSGWQWTELKYGSRPPSESEFARSASAHIDEISFVQDSLSRLYKQKERFGDDMPSWLVTEIGRYEDRLTGLVRDVRGG